MQREYPWGTADPGTSSQYAIYNCLYPSGTVSCSLGVTNIAPVGTTARGAGLWGQLDLAGNVYELPLDSYAAYADPCTDCAYIAADSDNKVLRGGAFFDLKSGMLATIRDSPLDPNSRTNSTGFRCARTP
jgi:formylglycine-generating enzyme required for sulfatase activity